MEPEVGIITDTSQTHSRRDHESNHDPEAVALKQRALEAHRKYGRGAPIRKQNIKDKKLRGNLRSLESKYKESVLRAQDAEILLENQEGFIQTEGNLEKTYKVRQDEIKQEIAVETAKMGFDLKLEGLGPYIMDYTRNGRGLLLAGRKGHVSTMDWRAGKLGCELQLRETVRDAKVSIQAQARTTDDNSGPYSGCTTTSILLWHRRNMCIYMITRA